MTRYSPTLDGLRQMLAVSRIELPDGQLKQLWAFHQLIHARNDDGDLTRLRAFESMVTLHYVDCLFVAQKLADKLPSPLLDIGSGAGFPGIPLKIALPQLHVILGEGRARRIQFMDDAIALLGLTGIDTWHGKVWSQFPLPVQGTISRALERIPVTLQRTRHFVPPGGLCVFMKGPNCDDEIAEGAIRQLFGEGDVWIRVGLRRYRHQQCRCGGGQGRRHGASRSGASQNRHTLRL